MRSRSFFGPLLLIAAGIVWLLVNMNIIPVANLWALTRIWPFVLIALGLGLLLSAQWRFAGQIVSGLVVVGALLAVIFAPQLGWAGGPNWNFDADLGGSVPASGKIKTETRDIQGFMAIAIKYPAEILVQQGKTESVTVEADDNLLPQLTTEVRNDTLYIENNEPVWGKRVRPSKTVNITITVKDLKEIDFSSAGKLQVENLKTDKLKMVLSGAGEVIFNGMSVQEFESVLSGAGSIMADGTADDVKLTISGFGSFDSPQLTSTTADVHISGAGSATLAVKDELTATVSGAGSVNYIGSPKVVQHISGAGSVKQAGK